MVARSVSRLGVATVAALALLLDPSAAATAAQVDPGALTRGEDPAVAHLVRNTIRDGDLEVAAPRRGVHEALWVVRGGYLVRSYNVGPRRLVRVVFVGRSGERRLVARSRQWIEVAVADNMRVMAVQESVGDRGDRTRTTVEQARTGRVLATRTLSHSTLVATTGRRVLLARRAHRHDPATTWWGFRRDRLHRLHDQAALRADIAQDRIVFSTSSVDDSCVRVAALSRPARTLWRSCRRGPHQWSTDGRHALVTRTSFDAPGTDRWWVAGGRTGRRGSTIAGRLDWSAVWEDERHFLTKALSESGIAAVIRCDLAGACERAGRRWHVPVPPDLFYASPPVILAR